VNDVRITAKVDYGIRALAEIAAESGGAPVKGSAIAEAQEIPLHFLENILRELRRAGIVRTVRGVDGGYLLARDAREITLADVIRALEGPLAAVQGERPEHLEYEGAATSLIEVWLAVRASLRAVLEQVTVHHLAAQALPAKVRKLADRQA
jgi:Rrf2 family protein